jgi:MFS family permease
MGRFFTTLAVQMQMTTIGLQIYYEYGRSELALGMTGLFEAIPFLAASFFSGYISDRYNRKNIMLLTCLALVFSSLLLFLVSANKNYYGPGLSYYAIFGVIVLIGTIRAFFAATMNPWLSQLIDRSLYTTSATLNSTAWHIASISGPILAALMYGLGGDYNAEKIYLTNVGLFLVGIFFFAIIKFTHKFERKIKEGILESLKVGIDFVFKQKTLLSVLSLDLFAVLFGGAIAILPAFNDKILLGSPQDLGLLRTAPGIGAVLMAIVLSFKPPGKNAGRWVLMAIVCFGVFTIGFALCTNYWVAFAMLLLTGAFDNVSVVIRSAILQLMTPDHMRGRVSAVNSVFIGSSNEIGGFESGLAARVMGLVNSVVFGGAMTILVVAAINKLNPKLKKFDITKV